ncbi:hypothetical protein FOL47_000546 [Perkinsus chesapeaki]|uniref:Uncharacterized protein n=1 Tax=Perkinsus chesapeaki TaxID=330153 RepID=A0A7J6N3S2_PERCH|nr:hypothetical protein FOL47_000546 [Perkinsus chesapeaki]
MTSPQVGAHVRCVVDSDTQEQRRGTVAWVGSHDCDMILDDDSELDGVPLEKVRPLEDFESDKASAAEAVQGMDAAGMAETVKGWGNTLFKLKDFEAASEWYESGLEEIQRRLRISSGSHFCIYTSHGQVKVARVLYHSQSDGSIITDMLLVDEKTMTASDSPDQTPVRVTDSGKLLLFDPMDKRLTQAQCAMMLNSARARLGRKRLSSQEVSVAIALLTRCMYISTAWAALDGDAEESASGMRDKALFWRAKAQARRSKYAAAHRDLAMMAHPSVEVQRLERELRREKTEDRRSTRKIVKELCKLIPEDTNFM